MNPERLWEPLVILEETPRQDVKIDPENGLEPFKEARGRVGLAAFDVRKVDVGNAQRFSGCPLGHLPLLTEESCRLTE